MERVLRSRKMITRSLATIDTQYSAVPSDYLEVRSLKVTSSSPVEPLTFVSIEEMDNMDAQSTAGGIPRYFTIVGNQIRVHPTPDGEYTTELVYYSKISKLSDSVSSNWILTSHPDVYLYGALIQAAPYLKDDERVNIWSTLYAAGMDALRVSDERAATSGGAISIRTKAFGAR